MPNAVLDRLETQRAEQITFVDQLLSRVESEGRDLVDAERANLTAARERIGEIDQQLAPLREFEDLRAASASGARTAFGAEPPAEPRPLGTTGAASSFPYRSAGAYLVDYVASLSYPNRPADPGAAARIEAARHTAIQNQITTDTPGLLPHPIIGPIVNTLDASRPLITSLGAKPLAGIAGTGFSRPKITQHVDVGPQAAEKTELTSRKMVIGSVPFTKGTYGGAVDISRQDIDWTSPSAWDALVNDLAAVYGAVTEAAVAGAFGGAGITQTVAAEDATLEGWAKALYEAAVLAYLGGATAPGIPNGRLPDHIWVSLDMWASMGAIVDTARLMLPPSAFGGLGEQSGMTSFAGDILNAPRTVVWGLPAGTIIVGSSAFFEFYEDQVGLLTAVEPKLFGVEAAYGGYAAFGFVEPMCFAKVTAPPVVPLGTRSTAKTAS